MRRALQIAVVGCLAFQSLSIATPLPGTVLTAPGSTVLPGLVPAGTAAGTLLASLSSPFSFVTPSGNTNGTLVSAVYRNSSGTLDFYYQVTNSPNSTTSISRETNTNFAGFQTFTGFRADSVAPFAGGTVAPVMADNNATGTVIGFSFGTPSANNIAPGMTSDILVISTNATNFAAGNASVINGGVQTVAAFQPASGNPGPVLYATEKPNQKIVQVNVTNGTVTDIHITPGQPDSLLLDKFGRFIYDEGAANVVRVFDPAANTDTALADATNGISGPQDMALTPDGNFVLVSNFAAGTITSTDILTGATTVLAHLLNPKGLAFDNKGNLFVLAGFGNGASNLFQIDPASGTVVKTSATIDGTGTLDGLAFDALTGALFATAQKSSTLYRIDPATLAATNVATISAPDGVFSDTHGLLYVASGDSHVYQFNATTNALSQLPPTGGVPGLEDLVIQVVSPPSIGKTFASPSIPLGGTTALNFTITNPNATGLSGVGFTDALPAGLVVTTPNGATNTCGGTLTAVAGSSSISLSGGALAASASCGIAVNVTGTSAGTKNNTTSAVSSIEGGSGPAASATIVVVAPPSITKAFAPATIALNGSSTLSFTISNSNGVGLAGVAFTDNLPAGMVVATPNGVTGGCGNGVITAGPGSGSISLTGGGVAAGSACSFAVNVTATASGTFTNTTSAVTSTNGGTGNSASASLSVGAPPSITKAFGASTIALNGSTSLSFTVANAAGNVAATGVAFTDALPGGLVVATPNGLTGSCGGGAIAAVAGSSSVSLSGATLNGGASCAFAVNVTGTAAGVKANSVTVTSGNAGTGNTATATVTVIAPPGLTKSFGGATIALNGTTTLTFGVSNPNATGLSGVGFTDALPAGLVVTTPNGATNTCGGTLTAVAGSSSISLSGGALAASASCGIAVNVTGTSAGTKNNTTSAVSSIEGGSGPAASATIVVVAPPSISKAFAPATIALNGSSTLSFTITNSNGVGLAGVAFTDNLPAGMVVATPNGVTGGCGNGVVTAGPGSGSISLTGGGVAAGSACSFAVNVTATASGTFTNTTSAVTSTNGGTGNSASASLSVGAPPSITKAFGASTIALNGSTSLSFTVANAAGNVAATGVAFTDALPGGLVVATPNGLTGSCGGGAIAAVAGSSSVSLSGATLNGGASCAFAVNVTGTAAGVKANSVTVTSGNAGTGNTATATVTVIAPPGLTKSFGGATIALNGTTTLTFGVSNPNATGLSGVGFTDALPAGLVVTTPNGATNTCGGTLTAVAGSSSISLSGGALAASASCGIAVNVTGTSAGTKNNTTSAVSSIEGGSGPAASATIVVVAPPSISKAFAPATIALNGSSTLSFTITNSNGVGLAGVAFTDALPAGMVVATPNGLTGGCGNGVITAGPGSGSISLTGGGVAAGSACSFAVNVTATASGTFTNTTSAVTSTNGGTGNSASASLSVGAPPSITKAFGASTIALNGSTSLSFTVANAAGNVAATGVAFTDALPGGLVVATPNGLTGSCGGGAIAAVAGSSSVSLSGATLNGGASCAFAVNVTGTAAGVKANSVTVTSGNAGTGNTATATVTVIAPPGLTKSFGGATIALNGTTTLTFGVSNPNATGLSGVGFTDALPAGLVVTTPNGATNTCGGTLTAVAGSSSISLSGGALAASASCGIAVNVTGTSAGTKNNTTSAVSSIEGGSGPAASATIVVVAPPSITKAFAPATIALNGSSTLSFTISNSNGVGLAGVAFTDNLPAGMVVATPNGLTGGCGNGVITAAPGSSAISMTGATLAASASCTVSVNVKAIAVGAQTNCVTANVAGSTGNQSCATLSVTPTLTITSACLAGGTINVPFSYALTVTGGAGPYTYTLLSAPAGLTLNAATGVVSGTPTTTGQGSLSIKVTDSGTPPSQQSQTQTCGISINSAKLQILSACPASPLSQGATFALTLAATGGDGNYVWSIATGGLPAGLSLIGNRIGGTPTGPPGTANFSIQVVSEDQTVSQACTVTVTPPKLQIASGCPSDGTQGVPYPAFVLSATGGTGGYVFSIANGSLPAGLSLNGNAISGTPQGPPGPSSFTIQVTSGGMTATTGPCSMTIGPPALTITGTCPATGQVGTPISATVTATGGKAPYTFNFNGSSWLSFKDGTVSGTPPSAGTGSFSVTVSDAGNSPPKTFACSFPVTTGLQITGSCPADPVTLGQPFSVSLTAAGGTAPYRWSVSGQPWISLSSTSGTSVTAFGTAPAAGSFPFVVTLSDGAGSPVATFGCSVTVIAAATNLQIRADPGCPASPLPFQSGVTISLTAAGGVPPYTWAVSGPSWLSLSSSSGAATVLSGKASIPGTASFSITLADSGSSQPGTFSCILTVTPPPIPPITITVAPPSGPNPLPPTSVPTTISLPTASPVDLHGMLQLTFIPNASNPIDNPQVHFSDPCLRLCSFTIPAGTQSIKIPNVEQGTVAGTIHIEVVQLLAGDVDVLPPNHPAQDLTVPAIKPAITSMMFQNETATGFDIVVGGFSTPRNMTSATITFGVKAGMQLDGDTTFTVSLSSLFTTFYQSSRSTSGGSSFDGLRFPVTISGDKNAIGSVTVVLTNSVGASDPMTLQR